MGRPKRASIIKKMHAAGKQPVMVGQNDRKWALERQRRAQQQQQLAQQQGITLGELQQRHWDAMAARARMGA
jgi:hypothetical protein